MRMAKERLLRCLSVSVRASGVSSSTPGRECWTLWAAALYFRRKEIFSASSASSVSLIVYERVAISLLRTFVFLFSIRLLRCFSSLRLQILALSSFWRNSWSIENTSLICLSVSRAWTSIFSAVWSKSSLTVFKSSLFSCKGLRSFRSPSL